MPSPSNLSASRRTRFGPVLALALAVVCASLPVLLQQSIVGRFERELTPRLGRASAALVAPRFVREALAEQHAVLGNAVPIIVLDGTATVDGRESPIPHVIIYGVDDRFWRFHDRSTIHGPSEDDVVLSSALASALATNVGAYATITIPFAADVPLWTLHGRRDDSVRSLRLRVAERADAIGALSPLDTSRDALAAYVSLRTLQAGSMWEGRVNAIVTDDARLTAPTAGSTAGLRIDVAPILTLDDYGLHVRADPALRGWLVGSRDGTLDDPVIEAVTESSLAIGAIPTPALTTMVSRIRLGDREVPYSFVTSIELQAVAPDVKAEELEHPPILLTEWTATRLSASVGEAVSLEYPVKHRDGSIGSDTGQFEVAAIVPARGAAASASLTPRLPGITGTASMRAWMPRVPFDVDRLQPPDDEYWARYGAAPKAFVPPQVGRALWRSSIGAATSVLVTPPEGTALDDSRAQLERHLLERLTPALVGLHTRDLRSDVAARVSAAHRRVATFKWYALPVVAASLLLVFATRFSRATVLGAGGAALVSTVALVAWPPPAWERLVGTGHATRAGTDVVVLRTTLPMLGSFNDADKPGWWTRLGLTPTPGMLITPFRVHDTESPLSTITAGPRSVRLGGVTEAFIDRSRFTFAGSLDRTDEERANPWLLLRREPRDPSDPTAGPAAPIVPVVASVRTLHVLNRDLGDDIAVESLGRSVRLRVMASLEPGLLDGVLWMRETVFLEWLPAETGYRWFSIERPGTAPPTQENPIRITDQVALLGAHVVDTMAPAGDRPPELWQSWIRFGTGGAVVILALAAWSSAWRRRS